MRTGSWGVRAGAVPVRSQHESQSFHDPRCSACEYVRKVKIDEHCCSLKTVEEH